MLLLLESSERGIRGSYYGGSGGLAPNCLGGLTTHISRQADDILANQELYN